MAPPQGEHDDDRGFVPLALVALGWVALTFAVLRGEGSHGARPT